MTSFRHSHIDDAHEVGRRLREARVAAGLSQRGLAFEGCSPAYISRLEAGERVPSLQLLRKIAAKLGADENYLATGVKLERCRPQLLVDADVALRLDDLALAEELYGQAWKTGDARARAEALGGLGRLAFRRGDTVGAIESIEEALAADPSLRLTAPGLLDTLGRAYATSGQPEAAIGVFERALADAGDRGDALEERRFGVLLANALIDSGNYGRAEEVLGAALARLGDDDDPVVRARVLWSQSRLHSLKGDQDIAAVYARRTLDLLELTEDTQYRARAYHLLGYIELGRGRPAEALESVRKAIAIVGDSTGTVEQAQFRLEQARALAQLGEREEAAAEAMAVAALLNEADPHDAARCYVLIGDVFADLGDRARALELYELGAELLGDRRSAHASLAYERLAKLLEEEGRTDEALQALKRALGARQALQQPAQSD